MPERAARGLRPVRLPGALRAAGLAASFLGGCQGSPGPPALKPPLPPPSVVVAPTVEKPKPDEVALLFPHHNGDHWEMTVKGEEGAHKITLVAEARGERVFSIGTLRDGKQIAHDTYRVDPEGVYFVSSDLPALTRIEPPLPLLKRPLRTDSAWKWTGVFKSAQGNTPAEADIKVTGPDMTTTPAGTFPAYRITQKVTLKATGGNVVSTTEQWVAPNIGLIRQTTENPYRKGEVVLDAYKVSE